MEEGEFPLDGSAIKLELLELALKASHEGIWDWQIEQGEIHYSRRILEFLECSGSNAPNLFLKPHSFIHPEDQPAFAAALSSALEDRGPDMLASDARVRTGSGEWRWLRIRGTVVRNRQGKALRIAGSMIDISRRKLAESQVIEERFQLRQLIDHIPVQVYFKDKESRFVMANQRMAEWIGLKSSDELIGKHDRDFFADEHWQEAALDEKRIIRTGEPVTNQLEHEPRPDGEETWVLTSKFPWRDRYGVIKGTFGVSSDVTKLVLAQRETTRLAEELQKKNESYEEELLLAREIQQALGSSLPQQLHCGSAALAFSSRYIPISGLAGDFFEVFQIDDTRVGLLICDVMGHGVRSALVVAMLRGLIEKQRAVHDRPDAFLEELNDGLVAILERAGTTMFATAFYGVIDYCSLSLTYSNAGHPGPVLVDDQGVRQIGAERTEKGPALGLLRGAQYPLTQLDIRHLKRLVLFTDGVLEAENRLGEPYFEGRLMEIIRSQSQLSGGDLLDEILASVLDHSNKEHFDDDVCLLAVEVGKVLR